MADDNEPVMTTNGLAAPTFTGTLTINNPIVNNLVFGAGMFATVTVEGEVSINWKSTEDAVSHPKSDPLTLAIARLMIAIRDGTYKPMEST